MSPAEGALAVAAAVLTGAPIGAYLARRHLADHPARLRAQDDRDLLRLARNARKHHQEQQP